MNFSAVWQVLKKELVDALRDRRTLTMVVISSVLLGPLMLLLLSTFVSNLESQAQARTVSVQGLQAAPALANFFARQGVEVKAITDSRAALVGQLSDQSLAAAVLVVPADFEAVLARGEEPQLEVLFNSGNTKSQVAATALGRLVRGFAQEQATLRLAWRGLSPAALEIVEVQERDLAPPDARSARIATLVPFFLLSAVLYGALGAALDSTAGERERGSLEPLLMNPVRPVELVAGKWAAVSAVAMLIAVLGCLSFLPGQWLLRSESLSASFRFGAPEALVFIALLVPLAACLAAVLMAVAIRSKTFKEAQASATFVLLAVSLLPLVTAFDSRTQAFWQLLVPGLAQLTLMRRVLEGTPMALIDLLVPVLVSAALVLACLAWVARSLHAAALK
jgi:sodium transport system permease protein